MSSKFFWKLSKRSFSLLPTACCFLAFSFGSRAIAIERKSDAAVNPSASHYLAQTTPSNSSPSNSSTQPAQPRLRPNFSEEERKRRFNQRGFADTFLSDSLNGVSDLLGGGSGGSEFAGGNQGLSPLTPEQRGIIQQPTFDPTDVIIPRSGINR